MISDVAEEWREIVLDRRGVASDDGARL